MVYFGTLTEVSFVDDATSFAFMHVVAVVTSSFRLVIDCIRVVAADVLVSAVVAHQNAVTVDFHCPNFIITIVSCFETVVIGVIKGYVSDC